jgi:hypothetical protein
VGSLATRAQDTTGLNRQIDTTERQIDQLVYDLYGLRDAEIAVVEQASVSELQKTMRSATCIRRAPELDE